MTEWLHFHFSLSCFGEGNGNPLQCSCLENPRDRGAWWAAVYGVTQSWTQLERLSSSSSSSSSIIPATNYPRSKLVQVATIMMEHHLAASFTLSICVKITEIRKHTIRPRELFHGVYSQTYLFVKTSCQSQKENSETNWSICQLMYLVLSTSTKLFRLNWIERCSCP